MTTPRNQSVFKAFAMLKSFRRSDEWLTSSELSRRANLPEASGYRLIQTLEEIGAWFSMSDDERRAVMAELPKRLKGLPSPAS